MILISNEFTDNLIHLVVKLNFWWLSNPVISKDYVQDLSRHYKLMVHWLLRIVMHHGLADQLHNRVALRVLAC